MWKKMCFQLFCSLGKKEESVGYMVEGRKVISSKCHLAYKSDYETEFECLSLNLCNTSFPLFS